MSNETKTQPAPQVHNVTSVGDTTPETPVVPKPKRFSKTRNAARKTTEAVKRNKTAALLTVGAAAGTVATVLLKSQLEKNNEEVAEEDVIEDETPNLTLLESYNDAEN